VKAAPENMPELPDVVVYVEALERLLAGCAIERVEIRSPFLVRSVEPEVSAAEGKQLIGFRRLGKRIVWELAGELFLVFHLMIAGRFHWKKKPTRPKGKNDLAVFQFDHGTMLLTEASAKKRASLHVVQGEAALAAHDPAGLEVLDCGEAEFRLALRSENHTLKRALTSPKLFSGIGNAYSDEILHAARLSPLIWTSRLNDAEISRLFSAVQNTLRAWTERLREATGDAFPEKVTAFRPEMAVHGRFGEPCSVCGTAVQRIVYAENECNYCPRCQTGGKLLADRSLSRLLKDDWPRTIDEWEGA
jgi:formamidopyrimidine-DNA glycosylase